MVLGAFFRARLAVLGLLCVAAVVVCVLYPHGLPLRAAFTAFLVSAAISFVHLRHLTLAPLVGVAPLPGLFAAHAFGAVNPLATALCILPGLACAMFASDDIATHIIAGADVRAACEGVLRKIATGAAGIGIAGSGLSLYSADPHGLAVLAATVGAGVSALLVVPLGAAFLAFDEDFVTRFNRVREWRERMTDMFAIAAEPRWSMSITGIAIVFAVLGFFGAGSAPIAYVSIVTLLLACTVAGFGLTRGWRRALSLPVVMFVLSLLGAWGFARAGEGRAVMALMQTLGICIVPLLSMAAEAGRNADTPGASSLALMRKGPVTFFFFVAAILIVAVQFGNAERTAAIAVLLVFGCLATLVALPAVTGALETLFPTKAALEARYRVH